LNALRTPFCELLGIELPLVGAGMGPVARAELAAAVALAGALGTVGAGGAATDEVLTQLRRARSMTRKPLAVNFVLHVVPRERVLAVLDEGVEAVATGWGDPAWVVAEAHTRGAAVLHRVTTAAEARAATAAGVDVLVAQGSDAGGHTGSVPTFELVPAVVDAAAGVPVLAAGGIADGRGLAAALALGAQGAVVGTRLVASAEAFAHERYKARVVAADETESVLTTAFELGWPGAPHRVLRNATVDGWHPGVAAEGGAAIAHRGGVPIPRYFVDCPTADVEGAIEEMALYAGPSAVLARDVLPAGEIVRQIAAEAEAVLARLAATAAPARAPVRG
jgi:NAD(P)H-dependent flavin oxidoreductase YrpB (nitropropane dioxygenase family)